MDVLTPEQRHKNMSRIRSKDTRPEIAVRSLLHKLGFRFRINVRNLPGTPDIVLPKYRTVVFVNGCFWHRHKGCKFASTPATNALKWEKKFQENIKRDERNFKNIQQLGWSIIVVWECEIRNLETLTTKLTTQLMRNLSGNIQLCM